MAGCHPPIVGTLGAPAGVAATADTVLPTPVGEAAAGDPALLAATSSTLGVVDDAGAFGIVARKAKERIERATRAAKLRRGLRVALMA